MANMVYPTVATRRAFMSLVARSSPSTAVRASAARVRWRTGRGRAFHPLVEVRGSGAAVRVVALSPLCAMDEVMAGYTFRAVGRDRIPSGRTLSTMTTITSAARVASSEPKYPDT